MYAIGVFNSPATLSRWRFNGPARGANPKIGPWGSIALLIALVAGCVPGLWAQNIKSAIQGHVSDASGGSVQNAEVSVSDRSRGALHKTTSNDTGAFFVPGLEAGSYVVEVKAPGFTSFVSSPLEAQAGRVFQIEAKLQVGGTQTAISVSTDAAVLQVEDTKQSRTFSATEMNDLPVRAGGQGRNFYAQAATVPGVVRTTAAHQPFAISGNRSRSNSYLIDSVDATDSNTGLIAGRGVTEQLVSQEAISGFEVLTHNFKAEYGRNSGGVLSIVTKSGTNDWHGSAYWYVNHSALAARNFFDTTKPDEVSHLPGFTIGGPLRKNRAFLFTQFETLRVSGTSRSLFQGLTDAERASAAPSVRPLVNIYPQIPSSGSRIFSVNIPGRTDLYTGLVRGDFNLNERQSLMVRVSKVQSFRESNSVGNILGSSAPGERATLGATIQHNWTLAPNILNEARLGFNRQVALDSETPTPLLLGDPALNGNVASLRVTGLSTLGIPTYLNSYNFQNNFQFMNDATWSHGRHVTKAGFSFRRIQVNDGSITSAYRGSLVFNSIANFLAGTPQSYSIIQGNPRVGLRRSEIHGYVQDDWKILPKLTLNLGLRYELNTSPTEVAGRIPNSLLLPNDRNNFAPRFGLAWQANDKTVIRVGYGIYFNVVETSFIGLTRFAPPFLNTLTAVNPTIPNFLANSQSALPSGIVIPNRDTATPYSQHLNFTLERQLGNPRSTFNAAYVGTLGRKLSRTRRPNGGDQLAQTLRPDPSIGVVSVLETSANSSYHAFQAGLTHRFNESLLIRASYTFSKFLDDISDIAGSNTNLDRGVIQLDEKRLFLDRGLSAFHMPHVFTVTSIYRIPGLRGNRLLGGWSLSGIVTAQSGRPFTIFTGTNTPLGDNVNRPLGIAGAFLSTPSEDVGIRYARGFSAASLTPAAGTWGSLARNAYSSAPLYDLSLSLSKDIRLSERFSAQVRGELYNALNQTNFVAIDNIMTSPTFGRYTSASDPRRGQLALRLVF